MKTLATILAFLGIAISAFSQAVPILNPTNGALQTPTAQKIWTNNFSIKSWGDLTNALTASNNITITIDPDARKIMLASPSWQAAHATLTLLSALTGGNPSNFFRGDGTFQQVSTNDIPGLVQALADGVAGGGGGGGIGGLVIGSGDTNIVTNAVASAYATFVRSNGMFYIVLTDVPATLLSGEIDDARIPSGISRDPEVAALYAALLGDNIFLGHQTISSAAISNLVVYLLTATNFLTTTWTNSGDASIGGTLGSSSVVITNTLTLGGRSVSNLHPANSYYYYREWEFMTPSSQRIYAMAPDLIGQSVGTGGSANALTGGSVYHPGVFRITSGSTSNSGYCYLSDISSFSVMGGEEALFKFRVPVTNNTQAIMGFYDTTTTVTPVDGMMLKIAHTPGEWGVIQGVAYSSGTPTITTSSTNVDLNTWYSGSISNSIPPGTLTFRLLSESGSPIWSDSLTNGWPDLTNRVFGFGFTAISTNSASTNVLDIDFVSMGLRKELAR